MPFLHVERGGKLAWAGGPEAPAPADAFVAQGVVDLHLAIPLPDLVAGESARVLAGLWYPGRIGREDERLFPDQGEPDRRVLLGTLAADADGRVQFTPQPGGVKDPH
jgi:hypothetical protein